MIEFSISAFFMGMADLTAAQVGHYIRRLCFQHQKRRLNEAFIRNITKDDADKTLMSKIIQDENGLYYIETIDVEIRRRAEYTQSRRRNLKSKTVPDESIKRKEAGKPMADCLSPHMAAYIDAHMDAHIETETETGIYAETMPDADADVSPRSPRQSPLAARFDDLWEDYPRKQGRALAFKAYQRAVKEGVSDEEIREGIHHYLDSIERLGIEASHVKQGDTFFSRQSWADDYAQAQEPESRYTSPFID